VQTSHHPYWIVVLGLLLAMSTVLAAPGKVLGPSTPPELTNRTSSPALETKATADDVAKWVGLLASAEPKAAREAGLKLSRAGDIAVDPLLAVMDGKNIQARKLSAWALGKLKAPRATKVLLDTVQNDGEPAVRIQAILALSEVGEPQAYTLLVGLLGKEQEKATVYNDDGAKEQIIAQLAQRALILAGAPAADSLIDALRGPDANVRRRAAAILAEVRSERTVVPLLAALNDPDVAVRQEVTKTLGRLGDRRALNALVGSLKDPNALVRQEAARSLGAFGDDMATEGLTNALKDQDAQVRKAAVQALSAIKLPSVLDPLLSVLADSMGEIRAEAVTGIYGLVQKQADVKELARAVPVITPLLKDPDTRVRISAAATLAALRDPAAVDPLIAALSDKQKEARDAIVSALAMLKSPKAIDPLIALLKQDGPDPDWTLIWSLAEFADARVVPPLLTAMKPKMPGARAAASMIFRRIGAPATEPLIAAMRDTNASIRLLAVLGIGQMPEKTAIPALKNALKDKDPQVAAAAALALGTLKDPTVIPLLANAVKSKDAAMRDNAALALLDAGPKGVTALINLWNDPSPTVHTAVNRAISQMGKEAVNPLIAALKNPNAPVRSEAAAVLGWLKDDRAIPPLAAALKDADPKVRAWIITALGNFTAPRALTAIRSELTDFATFTYQKVTVSVACVAITTLHASGASINLQPVYTALKSGNDLTRVRAAQALGWSAEPKAVTPLIGALKDRQLAVRREAALALGQLHHTSAIPALITALQDSDPTVRAASAMAMSSFTDPRCIPPLIKALNDKTAGVCMWASYSLGKLKATAALPALLPLLKATYPPVVNNAADALKAISGKDFGTDYDRWAAWVQSRK